MILLVSAVLFLPRIGVISGSGERMVNGGGEPVVGPGGAIASGWMEYVPIVKIAPLYPRKALEKGIEGYVLLEFTVSRLGNVADVVVLESDPPGVFEEAAIYAVKKYKYRPLVVDGNTMVVKGVRDLVTFEIAD